MTASTDTTFTASAWRAAGVGAAVVVLTPALGAAAAVVALPLFAVMFVVGVSLGDSPLVALVLHVNGRSRSDASLDERR